MLSVFPRGVSDEILNLMESVSEGFPSCSFIHDGEKSGKIFFQGQGNVREFWKV